MGNREHMLENLNEIKERVKSVLQSPFEMWEFGAGYYDGVVAQMNKERSLSGGASEGYSVYHSRHG